jgi:hypothetical protein
VRAPSLAVGLLALVLGSAFCGAVRAQDEMPKEQAPQTGDKAVPIPAPVLPNPPPADQGSSALPPGTMIDESAAILQALDKVTARVRKLPVKVGQTAAFGTLSVEVDACRKAPPEDPPESAAFLTITDRRGETPQLVFKGWMFASSPALSAMDHPVYDIWVIDCAGETAAPAPAPSMPPHTLPAAPVPAH